MNRKGRAKAHARRAVPLTRRQLVAGVQACAPALERVVADLDAQYGELARLYAQAEFIGVGLCALQKRGLIGPAECRNLLHYIQWTSVFGEADSLSKVQPNMVN